MSNGYSRFHEMRLTSAVHALTGVEVKLWACFAECSFRCLPEDLGAVARHVVENQVRV